MSTPTAVPETGSAGLLDTYRFARMRRATIQQWLASSNALMGFNFLGRRMAITLSPDAAQAVAINRDRAFAAAPAWDFLIGVAFKRGLLSMDFEEHHRHRAIMQQAFTPQRLRGYLNTMQPMLQERVGHLPTGRVPLGTELKEIMLDVAISTFVGVDITPAELEQVKQAFHDCLGGITSLVRYPIPGGAWAKARAGRRTLEKFFAARIAAKRTGESNDLFSALCHARTDEGDTFSDTDIVGHMIFMLFAAHDTTSTAVTTMAYQMARHPQWQATARAEAAGLPEVLTYEALDEMDVIDRITKESLRLNAPVPIMSREALRDTVVDGHHVPKGTLVMVSPEAIQLSPAVWRDPNTFDPDRFTVERSEQKFHRYAWMPFGGGVHKCIGLYFAQMEIKVLMHQLLPNYEWSIPANYRWRHDPRTLGEPKDGLLVTLNARPEGKESR